VAGAGEDVERVPGVPRHGGLEHRAGGAGVDDQQPVQLRVDGRVLLGLDGRVAAHLIALAGDPGGDDLDRLGAHRGRARQREEHRRGALLGERHVEHGRVLLGGAREAVEGGAVEHGLSGIGI
jgi:hypothetical protein